MTEESLYITNQIVKRAFLMANYMYLYNSGLGDSVLIPEKKINGEGELDYKPETPKSP